MLDAEAYLFNSLILFLLFIRIVVCCWFWLAPRIQSTKRMARRCININVIGSGQWPKRFIGPAVCECIWCSFPHAIFFLSRSASPLPVCRFYCILFTFGLYIGLCHFSQRYDYQRALHFLYSLYACVAILRCNAKVKWSENKKTTKMGTTYTTTWATTNHQRSFFFLFISFYPIYVYILHIKIETGRTDYDLMAFRRKRTLCHRYWPYGCHFCRRNLNGSDDECCGQFESDDICSINRAHSTIIGQCEVCCMPTQLVDILCVFYVIQKIVSISIMFCILLDVIVNRVVWR